MNGAIGARFPTSGNEGSRDRGILIAPVVQSGAREVAGSEARPTST